ncbi:UNKNOWN [Stylonychia lemnae]|uniref:Uncharacterized protein n=1 Tax=Stylonychia lemnae TaxID=5949 RepID=A0A078AC86_STYLE|nr:UNKNOWN [Stylonychia lemnae]|eukprot:CDW79870.1 UNKNOWN [Stylonychia lemnae]
MEKLILAKRFHSLCGYEGRNQRQINKGITHCTCPQMLSDVCDLLQSPRYAFTCGFPSLYLLGHFIRISLA